MLCTACGVDMKKTVRDYQIHDDIVGLIGVPKAELWECKECGHVLYPAATASRISAARRQEIEKFIMGRPIGSFVSARTAARMIGHTKQAFSKNQRIKNGFIYSVEVDKRRLYLRSSVRAFGKTGDGRHRLFAQTEEAQMYEPLSIEALSGQVSHEEHYSERRADSARSVHTPLEPAYV
jgi:hypothetical protein